MFPPRNRRRAFRTATQNHCHVLIYDTITMGPPCAHPTTQPPPLNHPTSPSRLGRLAESKVSYSKAAALEPHNPTIGGELRTVGLMSEHEARADAAKASGDFRGCIEHTQRALALAPEWARMQTLCGEAMLEANVPPGTVASQMSQVLKRQPSNADAFYVRGRALYAMGNLDQAEKHLRQALQLSAAVDGGIGAVYILLFFLHAGLWAGSRLRSERSGRELCEGALVRLFELDFFFFFFLHFFFDLTRIIDFTRPFG
jgi:tetratricopeptide (TPR) repeat protein